MDKIAATDDPDAAETARFVRAAGLNGVEALHATFVRHRYALHAHDTFAIALVERGAATFELECRRHTAPAGSVFVIAPGRPHTGESASSGGYTYKVLYVEPAAAGDRVGVDTARPPAAREVVVEDRMLARRLALVHRLLASDTPALAVDEALAAALVPLQPLLADGPTIRGRARVSHAAVRRARDYLDDRWDQPVALDELAAHAGLSPWRLTRIFRDELGLPPSAYQRGRRVQHAKHELRAGLPPARVAADCGFYDQSHLNRVFKEQTGTTPARYAGIR